jgi:hypothetical protein
MTDRLLVTCWLVALLLCFGLSPVAGASFSAEEEDPFRSATEVARVAGGEGLLEGVTGYPLIRREGAERYFGEVRFRASQADRSDGSGKVLEQDYGWVLGGELGRAVRGFVVGDLTRGNFDGSDRPDPATALRQSHRAGLELRLGARDRLSLLGDFGDGFASGKPFYETYQPEVRNAPLRVWRQGGLQTRWSHRLGDWGWLKLQLAARHLAGEDGAADESGAGIKPPESYGFYDFRGYRKLDESRYSVALDFATKWRGLRGDGLEIGLLARHTAAESMHGLHGGGADWPEGAHEVWSADAAANEYLVSLGHRWQLTRTLRVRPRVRWARFDYLAPSQVVLPGVQLTYAPFANHVLQLEVRREVSTPPYLYAYERPLNDYTERHRAWADHSRLRPELATVLEAGWEYSLDGTAQVGMSTFYKLLSDVILSYDLWQDEDADPWTSRRVFWNAGRGEVWGVRTYLRKQLGEELSGWAQYVFSEAIGESFSAPSWSRALPYEFPDTIYLDDDIRHLVKLVLDYRTERLGGFAANLSWNYRSGRPFTPIRRHSYDPSAGPPSLMEREQKNSERFPYWSELDLLLQKNLGSLDWLDIVLNLQVLNLLDRVNVQDVNELSGDSEPLPYSGNTGTPRKLVAGLLFRL